MRAILVTADEQLFIDLRREIAAAGLDCSVERASTFGGAQLILETVRPARVFVDQGLAMTDTAGFAALRSRVADRAPFVGIGGNAKWAAQERIEQLLPRPLHARQLTLAIEPRRLERPNVRRVPSPSTSAETIEPLVDEAAALLGRPAVVQMARDFRAAPADPRRWHP